ncbi:rod-binding protein [Ferrimonas lipolytica]|uniref:Peptidoglycan hydrolase n=1 Tax=Ferrimonas lipolytica TaxID=2724191 RepID=A0A6H1UG59_9GAMM|nr:rod-binding protein [Ferrimonas lipolytica]QIZ76782.1 peptidoglycan hydrolase [Ferrimonas lipolytica]
MMDNNSGYLSNLNAQDLKRQYGQEGAIHKAGEQFEANFLQNVLKQMRSATDAMIDNDDDNPLSGGDSVFRDFYDAELAQAITKNSNLGFAEQMTEQLAPTLKSDSNVVAMDSYKHSPAMQPSLIQLEIASQGTIDE